jgi:hypothetical protein
MSAMQQCVDCTLLMNTQCLDTFKHLCPHRLCGMSENRTEESLNFSLSKNLEFLNIHRAMHYSTRGPHTQQDVWLQGQEKQCSLVQ